MTTQSDEIRNLRRGLDELYAEATQNTKLCSAEEAGMWNTFSRKITSVIRTPRASKFTPSKP